MFARNVAVSALLAFSVDMQVAGQGFKLQTELNSAKCLTAGSLTNGAAVVIEDGGTNTTSLNTVVLDAPRPLGFQQGAVRRWFFKLPRCDGATDGAQEFIFSEGSTIQWGGGIVVDGIKCLCVDVTDGVTTNGNQLQIWECTGNNSNQKFNMIPV
ncbi:hypothetical protein B0H13DRAFT_2379113 [Mycena leptocephala]|nr:hypothetical protein B0H13DRAFT_2379113 [Mycena leptocephala]